MTQRMTYEETKKAYQDINNEVEDFKSFMQQKQKEFNKLKNKRREVIKKFNKFIKPVMKKVVEENIENCEFQEKDFTLNSDISRFDMVVLNMETKKNCYVYCRLLDCNLDDLLNNNFKVKVDHDSFSSSYYDLEFTKKPMGEKIIDDI